MVEYMLEDRRDGDGGDGNGNGIDGACGFVPWVTVFGGKGVSGEASAGEVQASDGCVFDTYEVSAVAGQATADEFACGATGVVGRAVVCDGEAVVSVDV